MSFFGKKNDQMSGASESGLDVTASNKSGKVPTEISVAQFYMKQARAFEKSQNENLELRVKIAWRVAGVAAIFALVSLIGAVSLVVLKRPNPPAVLRVDASTGKVDVLPTTAPCVRLVVASEFS